MGNTHMQLHPDFKQLSMIHPPINRFSIALIQPLMRLLLRQQRSDAALEVKRLKIETAEFDCLRDGALLYAEKLQQAGIPVELHPTKGTVHGYDMALRSGIVQGLIRKRTAFLTNIFETH